MSDSPPISAPISAPISGGQPALILASTSRYRRELLQRLQLPFETRAPEVDEAAREAETPLQLSRRLSLAKAQAVAKAVAAQRPDALIIGSDQTATLDGRQIIGKPGSFERAREQLLAASGRSMTFHSGMTLLRAGGGFEKTVVIDTVVRFRPLSKATIEAYLHKEQPYDCAGSAKAEALGIALVESLSCDDPTAIVGLPLIALTGLLIEAGLPPLR